MKFVLSAVCIVIRMVPALSWLILIILPFTRAQYASTADRNRQRNTPTTQSSPFSIQQQSPRNSGDVEYRLTRLEVLLGEKLENLRIEARESSRRLQALEWQSAEVHSTLEGLRTDLSRIVQQAPSAPVQQSNAILEQTVRDVEKGVRILVTATTFLTADVNHLKKNVSSLINDTRSMLRSTSHMVTKQFFSNGILDLKHQQLYKSSLQHQSCPITSDPSSNLPKDCKEVEESGQTHSGIYRIQPELSLKPFLVVCDLETRGGGWTVIQNRFDGTQEFYQNWHEYKYGFGNLGGEFWLGLDNIHQLTGYQVNELLIELQDGDLQNKTAHYAAFSVGPEVEGFSLKILGGYSGDAGDSLMYHAGNRFSAKDMDQDAWHEGSCAQAHGGAWWYRSCDMSNLNGKYLSGELPEQYIYQGMYWGDFRGAQYSLLRARMLVRPRPEITPLILNNIFDSNITSIPKPEREASFGI